MKTPKIFDTIIFALRSSFDKLPDYSIGVNMQYAIKDAASAAFSVFHTIPFISGSSAVDEKNKGKNNINSLLGVKRVPSDNQIQNLLSYCMGFSQKQ